MMPNDLKLSPTLRAVLNCIIQDARTWMRTYPGKSETERNIYHEGVMTALRAFVVNNVVPSTKHSSPIEIVAFEELTNLFDEDYKDDGERKKPIGQ